MRQVWRFTQPTGFGAAVAVRCGDELLVVRQSFRPGLGLPGGAIEPDETAVNAAARELFEEVGLRVESKLLAKVGEHRIQNEHRSITTTVFELRLSQRFAPKIDQREIVWADWRRMSELDARESQPVLEFYRQMCGIET